MCHATCEAHIQHKQHGHAQFPSFFSHLSSKTNTNFEIKNTFYKHPVYCELRFVAKTNFIMTLLSNPVSFVGKLIVVRLYNAICN